MAAAVGKLFAYKKDGTSAERLAISLILLLAVISPLSDMIKGELRLDIPEADVTVGETEYTEVLRSSYEEGVRCALCDRFGLESDNVRVRLFGFSPTEMTAEKVGVTLRGKDIFADTEDIEEYVLKIMKGAVVCEVEVELG